MDLQNDLDRILQMRARNEAQALAVGRDPRWASVHTAEYSIESDGGSVTLLVYTPDQAGDEPLPAFISLHGGGFVMGRAWMDEPFCQRIASQAQCIVLSLDYRLAPEHPFPAALQDCLASLLWTQRNAGTLHVDPMRIAIGGYSAGGNLAAAACLLAWKRGIRLPCRQVLCYAPLRLTNRRPARAEGDTIDQETSRLFNTAYVQQPESLDNPLVSPILAADVSAMPPALLISAGRDPLMKDSETYAKKLEKAGVDATYICFAKEEHGFTHSLDSQAAEEAWLLIVQYLQRHLRRN